LIKDDFESTLLHDAVLGGNAVMVEHVCKTLSSANRSSSGSAKPTSAASVSNCAGRTPLHLASFLGRDVKKISLAQY
jgi:hypothetical protein